MGVIIKEVRLRNYKSYKSMDINLSDNCVLIGANNVGKTSFLQALQIAFIRGIRVSDEDIYVNANEILPKTRRAIIDILIVPTDENDQVVEEFDEEWFEHFGELRSEDKNTLAQFFAMRTIIAFNPTKGEFEIEKKALIEWPHTEDVETYADFKRNRITEKVLQSIPIFYMDAKRDIALEMKDRNSYWGRLVRDIGLENEEIETIESTLDQINNEIIERSPILKHLTNNLSKISKTVNTDEDSIKINPVSRKIRDLNRGIDLTFKDEHSERFPISNHGMGTRSWITFLTVVAYISWRIEQMDKEDMPYHPIVLLEEPEAHLHPQAQRKIFHQINGLSGQKIVSTHSPMIVGQVDIEDIRHTIKVEGITTINSINTAYLDDQEIRKIKQEILKSRGDLLFANAILLCEGETEDQALPTFFREYFGLESFEAGINIISVGGYGKYKPFLRIAKDLNIKVYLLSDGERQAIQKVTSDIKKVYGEETVIEELKGIKFLPNEFDFEKYLIYNGYEEELFNAMSEILGNDFLDKYISAKDQKPKPGGRRPTREKCEACEQFIYETTFRDYSGDEGKTDALLDCIQENKTAYSSIIADIIIKNRVEKKIPTIIEDLFKEMNNDLKIISEENLAVNV
jgi:putative ATP-dependent endonuclease of the OLD family